MYIAGYDNWKLASPESPTYFECSKCKKEFHEDSLTFIRDFAYCDDCLENIEIEKPALELINSPV